MKVVRITAKGRLTRNVTYMCRYSKCGTDGSQSEVPRPTSSLLSPGQRAVVSIQSTPWFSALPLVTFLGTYKGPSIWLWDLSHGVMYMGVPAWCTRRLGIGGTVFLLPTLARHVVLGMQQALHSGLGIPQVFSCMGWVWGHLLKYAGKSIVWCLLNTTCLLMGSRWRAKAVFSFIWVLQKKWCLMNFISSSKTRKATYILLLCYRMCCYI